MRDDDRGHSARRSTRSHAAFFLSFYHSDKFSITPIPNDSPTTLPFHSNSPSSLQGLTVSPENGFQKHVYSSNDVFMEPVTGVEARRGARAGCTLAEKTASGALDRGK